MWYSRLIILAIIIVFMVVIWKNRNLIVWHLTVRCPGCGSFNKIIIDEEENTTVNECMDCGEIYETEGTLKTKE